MPHQVVGDGRKGGGRSGRTVADTAPAACLCVFAVVQAASGELPHLMFYGPPGAGKKTRIMALLHAIYGDGVSKVKLERRVFKVRVSRVCVPLAVLTCHPHVPLCPQTPRNRNIEVTTVASNFHIEINPGDAGIYDRYIVQDVIKEIAQSAPLDGTTFKGEVAHERAVHAAWYSR